MHNMSPFFWGGGQFFQSLPALHIQNVVITHDQSKTFYSLKLSFYIIWKHNISLEILQISNISKI